MCWTKYKIENLDKDNNTTLLIKECYQRKYQSEEMTSRDIYNKKIKSTKENIWKSNAKCKNEHYLKIETEATTGDKEKLQSEAKDQNNKNSKNKYRYC